MNVQLSDLIQPFQEITKKSFPHSKQELKQLDDLSQLIYHHLVVMYAMPLRIIFGYYGFKTENGLRDGYNEYLKKHLRQKNYGPNSMPDLIICNNSSIIKINQQPFQIRSFNDGFFTLFASGTRNPVYYLLMMLWYKLQFRYNLSPQIWDFDTYSTEQMKIYMLTKLVKVYENDAIKIGWAYNYIPMTDEDLSNIPPDEDWAPFSLSKESFIVAMQFNHSDKIDDITKIGIPTDKFDKIIKELTKTRLFILDGHTLICNAKSLLTCIHGGNNYVCDNNDGDFNIWLNKQNSTVNHW